ncbi:hypothetical protein [Sporosarcina sp. NPDC096371]|uniref:hypothetical protein n=1 Tax=Sporosarcina sp. NPDC096371 TaxID=3364530 RepID=UPI00381FA1E5
MNDGIEYAYTRTKNVYKDDDGQRTLFIAAGIIRTGPVDGKVHGYSMKFESIATELFEMPIEEAPKAYLDLKDIDTHLKLWEEELEKLRFLHSSDVEAFCSYQRLRLLK